MKKVNSMSNLALEWVPIQLANKGKVIVDVFKCSLFATDGLPPYAQARIIDLIANRLVKARPRACLWVSVDAPGRWYLHEILRLVKRKMPIAILPIGHAPKDHWDFNPHGYPSLAENAPIPQLVPPFVASDFGYRPNVIRVLRILARLKTAHTSEIVSLAGFSKTHIRSLLKKLQAANLIERKQIGKYEGWAIRAKGLRLAHRSWNIPIGVHFTKYRGEFRYAGERHRRVSRRWRAWLEAAYPTIEIWESWTEVPLFDGIPDALAWGSKDKCEMLFWLEVDSGHSSEKVMKRNYARRLQNAYLHAKRLGIPIVFCIMGSPWVVHTFSWCIPITNPWVAIIGHDWRDFGRLPVYEFGRWNEDLSWSRYYLSTRSSKELPFDPSQYPSKPKREKNIKPPKSKSTKPKYSKGYDDADRYYRSRSEGEE
jgi:hypothetical protein